MSQKIEIRSPKIVEVVFKVEGLSPLLSNRKDASISQGIEDKKSGKNSDLKSKIVLTPEEQYQRSLHPVLDEDGKPIPNTYGFPASGFKKAGISAASGDKWWEDRSINGKRFKGSVFIIGDIIPIYGKLVMKTDDGRRPARTGAPCKIYRGQFLNWSCDLRVRYNADLMSINQIIAVMNMAGFAIGVGDDRPGKNGGSFGQFKIVGTKNIKE